MFCYLWHIKDTYEPRFRRPWGAIFVTFRRNLEKWELRFRVGVESKIKVSRTRALPFFMISMCIFSGPPFLLTCFEFLSDVLHFCVDFRSPFHLNSARFYYYLRDFKKIKRLDYMWSWGEGICGTSQIRGELGQRRPRRGSEGNCAKTIMFSIKSGATDHFACTGAS